MSRLLVDAPTGEQIILEVGEGGGYFDPARVLWDEREDGELPAITLGAMVRAGDALAFSDERKAQHDTALAPAVPASVTRRQAREILIRSGRIADVQPKINAILDPLERAIVQNYWDESLDFERANPILNQLAASMGISPAELDQLFITAKGL